MNRKHALVVTAIDGLATLECGIASMVHWYFEAFDNIKSGVDVLESGNWDLFAVSPRIRRESTDFSPEVFNIVAQTCQSHGGEFIWSDVSDDTSLRAVWSLDKPAEWRRMCEGVASEVEQIALRYDKVTVIVHGVMLTGLRLFLKECENVQVVFVTHSLGRIFEDKHSGNRTTFEDESFAEMLKHPQDMIAYVGPYTRDILKQKYHIPEERMTSLECGVLKESFRFKDMPSHDEMADYLQALRIPLDKKLVFSWGRCTGQKGFDVIIPAFEMFLKSHGPDWHLVLLMPQEVSPQAYVEMLDAQLAKLSDNSYTAIKVFDERASQYLLQMHALKMVIFASRFETGPLTLMEALAFGHEELRIVWNDIPPMAHQLRHQPHTYSFSPPDEDHLADTMAVAANAHGTGIDKQHIPDFAANMTRGMQQILAWWR